MIKKIWRFIKEHSELIIGILGILSAIAAIFGGRKSYIKKGYDKGYKDGHDDGISGGIKIAYKDIDKIIDKADSRGFDRGYNYPGSNEVRNNRMAEEHGIAKGFEMGKTSTLLDFTEPNINNPSQGYIARIFNVRLIKDSNENIDKLVKENKFDKLKFIKDTEDKIGRI